MRVSEGKRISRFLANAAMIFRCSSPKGQRREGFSGGENT